jgi:hypothetical protein
VIILVAKLICRIVMCHQHLVHRRFEESSYWVRLKQLSIVSFEGWPAGQTLPRYQDDGVSVDTLWLPLDNPRYGQQVRLTQSQYRYLEFGVILQPEVQQMQAQTVKRRTFSKPPNKNKLPHARQRVRHVKSGAMHSLLVGRERHVSTVTVTGLCLR